jgi:hypothetical protein
MATKSIVKSPMSLDQLQARLAEKLTGTPLDIPDWGTVEVTMLKAIEIQEINRATRGTNGEVTDAWLWNSMSAAKGLVAPALTPEQMSQYPPEFVMPIANKVWDLTNAYLVEQNKASEEPVSPFPRRSISSISSPIDSANSPGK